MGDHSGEDQFHQLHNKYKSGLSHQYLSGDHDCEDREDARPTGVGGDEHQGPKQNITIEERKQTLTYDTTPTRKREIIPRKRLFDIQMKDERDMDNIITEVVPINTDLEVLLINSCKINATKVQLIVNDFMIGNSHSTIFCMTETKVEGHDFQPQGIRMFSKHRVSRREMEMEIEKEWSVGIYRSGFYEVAHYATVLERVNIC